MRLWTIQPPEVFNIVNTTGTFSCNTFLSENYKDFREAYEWIAKKMIEKGIKPKRGSVKLPLWAWHTYDWKHEKPDFHNLGKPGEKYVCLEIEVPDEQVLLSDFNAWHLVLNKLYIDDGLTETESAEKEKIFRKLPECEQNVELIKSWDRVFDISPFENEWITRGRYVQATFWTLKKEMIINTEEFILE